MKRIIVALVCLILFFGAPFARAADSEITGSLFVPIAYLDGHGKIMDANHVVIGRIDKNGTVYDVANQHLGFVASDLTVRDVHRHVLAVIGSDGTMTDGAGAVVGTISDVKVTDGAGRSVARWEGSIDKRAVLAYVFFFSDALGR